MINLLKKFAAALKSLITEDDSVSYCLVRVAVTAAVIQVMFNFYQNPTHNFLDYAKAIAYLLAPVVGKNLTERYNKDKDDPDDAKPQEPKGN